MMFDLEKRHIYELPDWDGARMFRDPMRIWRRLREATGGKTGQLISEMRDKDPAVSSQATDALVGAFAFAAELRPFDPATGEGWTEPQLVAAVSDFHVYVNGLKKN